MKEVTLANLHDALVRFDAEGMEHGRSWCARLPGAPS